MSKHKKAVAARRKQHNKTVKARRQAWEAESLSRRKRWLEEKTRREAEAANVKITPPRSKPSLEDEIDAMLGARPFSFPGSIYFSNAASHCFDIMKALATEIDIEAAYPRTPEEAVEALTITNPYGATP